MIQSSRENEKNQSSQNEVKNLVILEWNGKIRLFRENENNSVISVEFEQFSHLG